MKELTKYNVEAWLLDYHEGQLSETEVSVLLDFVENNPELSIDPDFDNSLKLASGDIIYADKTDLYRTDLSLPDLTEEELECLALMEGDIVGQVNESSAPLFNLLSKTVLEADQNIVFENKQTLYKKRIILPTYVYGAIATAAMLIFAWFVFSPGNQTADQIQLAQDSTRGIIYLNKLVNPDEFDVIASNTPVKSAVKSSMPEIKEGTLLRRTDSEMTSIKRLTAHHIMPSKYINVISSNAFVYRTMPLGNTEEYKTFLAFSGEMIRKNVLGQDPELVEKSRFSLWELADVGLEKVASTFSLPMDINRQYNKEGDLVEVSFDSPLLAFSAPLNSQRAQ